MLSYIEAVVGKHFQHKILIFLTFKASGLVILFNSDCLSFYAATKILQSPTELSFNSEQPALALTTEQNKF